MTGNRIIYDDREFAGQDIKSGNCYLEISLLSDVLSVNTIEFEIESDDTGLVDFQRNTPLTYYHDDEQIGIFYVKSISRVGPTTYRFSGTSAMGLLDEKDHYGGIYTGQTAEEVILDICGDVPCIIKTLLRNEKLYGWLPVATARENLSQVLFAIGAAVKTDLNGVIRIEGLWDGFSGTIGAESLMLGGNVNYDSAITHVSVSEHQYIKGGGNTEQLFSGATENGDIITFDSPVYDLSANGFNIIESGANYARVSAGSGVLTGTKYTHITRVLTKKVADAAAENIRKTEKATLVSILNSEAVANRLVNYYRCIETIQNDIVYNKERPGAVLEVYHPYDKEDVEACIKNADINMSAKLRASIEAIVGFKPMPAESSVTYDNHEILTGEGTWIVPEGVTKVRLVLIGGGSGGQGGGDGGQGDSQTSSSSKTDQRSISFTSNGTYTLTASVSSFTNSAGQGGSFGVAGTAGKVYETVLEVVPGEAISFNCGSGGSGGRRNGFYGSAGGDTIFGDISSASGAVANAGYTDIVTGITYALPGVNGQSGGAGGGPGLAGKSVSGRSGGQGVDAINYGTQTGTYNSTNGLNTTTTTATAYMDGAGGGGAGGGNGGNGENAKKGSTTLGGTRSFYQCIANVLYSNIGGSGGNGASGRDGSNYGSAGSGGSGGGGAGCSSAPSVTATLRLSITSSGTGGATMTFTAIASSRPIYSSDAQGGAGGWGGDGADGCIILYYGAVKTITSRPFVTKDGLVFDDRYGRRLIA